jgi:hypothetical protein
MSTSYFLACKTCKVAVEVGSWGLSGFQFYRGHPDCMEKLHKLLEDHTIGEEHDIGITTEHVIYDDEAWKELEWKRNKEDYEK